jgi:DNA-binding NtrC family response regulator
VGIEIMTPVRSPESETGIETRFAATATVAAAREAAFHIVIIDDDPQVLCLLADVIRSPHFTIHTALDAPAGLELVARHRPPLVLLDLVMPGVNGMEMLDKILAIDPGVDVMLVTGNYSPESAVEAIRKGAFDYVTKPFSIAGLQERLAKWLADAQARQRTLKLDSDLVRAFQLEGIIGRSPAILELFSKIRRIAPHFQTALVTGETGTGKELVARALHRRSAFAEGPFVVCNCAAIPEHLFESELFGHVRGAFTGALQERLGFAKTADGGTLFLDEIGEIPLSAQAKLLRLLQNREVQRLGLSRPEHIDVRIVAATNRDLRTLVSERKLREDLYYRLSMIEVKLPRLSERREDLPMLQRHFLDLYSSRFGKPPIHLTRRAQAALSKYSWPGNVRELENVLAACCMMAEGETIDVPDLPEDLCSNDWPALTGPGTLLSLEQVQLNHAQRVLEHVRGNRAQAASILGISRATLYRLIARTEPQAS